MEGEQLISLSEAAEISKVHQDHLRKLAQRSLLQAEFPRDRIRRIPERSGADIEHEVFEDGRSCGLIVYESKNTASWSNQWIPKLKGDALSRSAPAMILVTQAFPAKAELFTSVDGVPVVHPRFLVSLVRVVRRGLIDATAQTLSQNGRRLQA